MSQDKGKTAQKLDNNRGSSSDNGTESQEAIERETQIQQENWTCPNCSVSFGQVSDQCWIECVGCLQHYDTDCIRMAKRHWQTVNFRKDIQWFCASCMNKYLPKPEMGLNNDPTVANAKPNEKQDDQLNRIELLQSSMSRKIENISKQLTTYTTEIQNTVSAKIQGSLKEVSEKLDAQSSEIQNSVVTEIQDSLKDSLNQVPKQIDNKIQKWSDLFKETNRESNNSVLQDVRMALETQKENIKKALDEQSKSDEERELRSRSIIVYKATEGKSATPEGRRKDDEKFVRELLEITNVDTVTVSRFDRLGKYDVNRTKEGKSRPLRIRFESSDHKSEMMSNLKKLAEAPPEYRKISVKHDLSQNERDIVRNKIAEAKQKTEQSTEFAYLVRGPPWNMKIIEVQKKY